MIRSFESLLTQCIFLFTIFQIGQSCPCSPQSLYIAQVLDCDYDKTLIDIPVRLCDFLDREVTVKSLPVDQTGTAQGALYQINNNYAQYSYEPKVDQNAVAISADQIITDSKKNKFRIVWRFPSSGAKCPRNGVRFKVSASACGASTLTTDVVLVPETRVLVSSDFSLNSDDWKVVGKEGAISNPSHESTSRGDLNIYIYYTDKEVKKATTTATEDGSKWYFQAPSKFLYQGIHPAYYGTLEFTIGMSSGDTSQLNKDSYLILFECDACASGTGTTIAYGRVGDVIQQSSPFGAQKIVAPLVETMWKKDPENHLFAKKDWSAPTQAEFIEVLSKISAIKILGDLTSWYESTAIDNVQIKLASGVNSQLNAHVNIPQVGLYQHIGR